MAREAANYCSDGCATNSGVGLGVVVVDSAALRIIVDDDTGSGARSRSQTGTHCRACAPFAPAYGGAASQRANAEGGDTGSG